MDVLLAMRECHRYSRRLGGRSNVFRLAMSALSTSAESPMDTDPPRLLRTVLSLNSPSQSCTTAHASTMLRSWLTLPSVITQLRKSLLNAMLPPYESRDACHHEACWCQRSCRPISSCDANPDRIMTPGTTPRHPHLQHHSECAVANNAVAQEQRRGPVAHEDAV